jgi:acyl dehydratase
MEITLAILAIIGYAVAPAMLVWGWIRWLLSPKSWAAFAALSFVGFLLASASGVLAASAIAYAQVRRFPYYDPLLMRIFSAGVLLSLAALTLGIGGTFRANPLRWHAPVSALATLTFWLWMASME